MNRTVGHSRYRNLLRGQKVAAGKSVSANATLESRLLVSPAYPHSRLPFVLQPWKLYVETRVSWSSAHARAFCSFVPPSVRSSIRPTICRLLVLCSLPSAPPRRAEEASVHSLCISLRACRCRIRQFVRIRAYT